MKKDVRREESFIFAIYNKRHNVNEILLILPFILALAFAIIGAPIIVGLCDISWSWLPLLMFGPLICVIVFYGIRKKMIMNDFIKVNDVSDKVEIAEIQSGAFEDAAEGKVFMFGYSEYMKTVLYNWFDSLNVIGDGKLKMYKVFYDNNAPVYLAVCEAELNIPEESRSEYEKETRNCLLLSDMMNGKVVGRLM